MIKPKLLAFHLPQFHTFPENDEWWGKGFTEWTNVKKAKPLHNTHDQPRKPLNNFYYDLTDPETIKWQMKLAEDYGLYGFCYYHYWFNGKLLLNKPLEIMLKMKKKINYCFCWANEPWTRAWDGLDKEVLMPQYYGAEEEWNEHFKYLLPFFKDEYYIKNENKPMLVLYRTNNIPNCEKMIAFFEKKCIENGFDGIYIVEEKNSFQHESVCKNSSAILEFEPMYTTSWICKNKYKALYDRIYVKKYKIINKTNLDVHKYEHIWKTILNRKRNNEKKTFLGAFIDWDNTPRKADRGTIMYGATPEKFKKFFSKQIKIASESESDYVFINAWNEWGEGTYLEPDQTNEYKYLEVIKETMDNL